MDLENLINRPATEEETAVSEQIQRVIAEITAAAPHLSGKLRELDDLHVQELMLAQQGMLAAM